MKKTYLFCKYYYKANQMVRRGLGRVTWQFNHSHAKTINANSKKRYLVFLHFKIYEKTNYFVNIIIKLIKFISRKTFLFCKYDYQANQIHISI